MTFPDPERSAAVLIGVANYAKKSPFSDLPAVKNNVADLARVLTDPQVGHLTRDRCLVLLDKTNPRGVLNDLRREAAKATDTFTIYFAGHGELGRDGGLHLVLKNGNHDDLAYTGIDFDEIREVMANCPARRRIVILDCCYSGSAIGQFMSSGEQAISSQTRITGTYTLTSSGQNKASSAPEGELYTAFSGELISLLSQGLSDAGEYLRLRDVFPALRDRLIAGKRPRPIQCSTDQVGDLALTRNLAFDGYGGESDGHSAEKSRLRFSDEAHEGSWFGGVDKDQGVEIVSSVPPLPAKFASGAGGAPAIMLWTALATAIVLIQWFSFLYTCLLVVGLAGIILETGASPADRFRRAGVAVVVGVSILYGINIVLSAVSSRWGLAFWNIVAVLLYAGGAISRVRYQNESARLAEIREREEGKPDHQRISEYIEKSPIAAKLQTGRWLGEPLDSPVFDALAHLPAARFIRMGQEGVESSEALGDGDLPKPECAAVCGRFVVAIFRVRWKAGFYRRDSGPTKDLRRNGKIYERGWNDVAEISRSVRALRSRIGNVDILGLIIVESLPPGTGSSSGSSGEDSAAVDMHVTDTNVDNGDVILTTEWRAAEIAGPFLAKESSKIDLDTVASILRYASTEARVGAGLSRLGTQNLGE